MVLSEVTLLLGSYPDPANSTSKYSDSVLGGNCLLGYALASTKLSCVDTRYHNLQLYLAVARTRIYELSATKSAYKITSKYQRLPATSILGQMFF